MSQDRVMLLIDADNVSIDIMEQAVQLLHKQHGGVHVRRAYCTAESAVKHQGAFKRMGIKPMVNLAAGKNSTDIALAVDAMDLVLSERPDVVVIASSDSDFAPLVQRLREKGCEVRGIGQQGKTGQETQEVYDDFTVLEHRKTAESTAAKRSPARKAVAARKAAPAGKTPAAKKAPAAKKVARRSVARPAAVDESPAFDADETMQAQLAAAFADVVMEADRADQVDKAETADVQDAAPAKPARKRAARKSVEERVAASSANEKAAAAEAPAQASTHAPTHAPTQARAQAPKQATAKAPAAAPAPAAETSARGGQGRTTLDAVLQCLSELQAGQSLPLNTAARRLRDAQLLGQNSSSLKLFSTWPERFELVPQNRPSMVRLRGG